VWTRCVVNGAVDLVIRFLLFAMLHSIAALPGVQQRIGNMFPRGFRFYRAAYNLAALVTFGWVMAAWPLSPVIYLVPGSASLAFHAVQAFTLLQMIRCVSRTGMADFLGIRHPSREDAAHELVTTGCYGTVRHPLYTLAMVFCLFNPLMTVKWLLFTLMAGGYFVMGAVVEERRLEREFGDAYRSYRRQVPMLIPRRRKPVAKE
jgi:protein-S-isoprenylcysteine O-methyltransferase Ste14